MKKYLSVFTVITVASLSLGGCTSSQGGSGSAGPSASTVSSGTASTIDSSGGDDVLNVWCFYEGIAKDALQDYADKSGAKTNFLSIGWNDYPTKLNSVLGTDDEPDIVFLEHSFAGTYLPQDNFVNLQDVFGDQPELQSYIDNTLPATADPGYYNGALKAIGWECPVGAFFYRSDIASEELGINSVDDMEAAISTKDDFYGLQDKLDAYGSGVKLVADINDLVGAIMGETFTEPWVTDGTLTITTEFQTAMKECKDAVDRGLFYTNNDKTSQLNGAAANGFLGDVAPSWYVQVSQEFEQPGVWAVAKSPFKYASGGTWIAVTQNADMDLAWGFLSSTFLNDDWLTANLDSLGFIGNSAVIDNYESSPSKGSDYYKDGQDVIGKFYEIAKDVPTSQPVTQYDSAINIAYQDVMNGYLYQNAYASEDDALQAFKAEVLNLAPDLNVVIE